MIDSSQKNNEIILVLHFITSQIAAGVTDLELKNEIEDLDKKKTKI
ncbi:MAG: hypothetical protein Q7J34_02010 [Bacteroidales bacterium]|nr:hypothetical protein [Bacteroidales bacterium]